MLPNLSITLRPGFNMQMNDKFVKDVVRLFKNEVLSEPESRRIVEVLESREEFLAWLLLKQDIMKPMPEASAALMRAALGSVDTVEPRRAGFPIMQQRRRTELESTLKSLLGSSEAMANLSTDVHRCQTRTAISEPTPGSIRWSIVRFY
jgi:hypothetical protein